ncbi:hypothetical protein ACGFNU_47715 [Spirillospora sp. NPDC048911]|uniref:hypothetical protein n=1 Tax=Spirillospora sp. NPDC048911 TaxID=3364527 RepID=UPI0037164AE9
MAFKLIKSLARRQRTLVALVQAGATIAGGKFVERPGDQAPSQPKDQRALTDR